MNDQEKTKPQLLNELLELRLRVAGLELLAKEYKHANEALQKSEEKFSKAFLASPDGITIARLRDGMIFDINESFVRITGYTRDEVIGKSVAELKYWVIARDRKKFLGMLRRKGECIGFATVFCTNHGKCIPALISARIITIEGDPCVLSVIRDISKLKTIEQALRESEKRYRRLFEESMDAIFYTTREGIFVDVNHSMVALFGYSRVEFIEKVNVTELYVLPGERERVLQKLEGEIGIRDYPVRFRNRSGGEMDCVLSAVLRCAEDGSILGYQGIVRDVTKQHRTEEAVKLSEARYRAIVEDQTELICRFLPDGTITFVNGAYCRYFGKKYEELVGRSFMPFIPEEDHEQLRAQFAAFNPKHPVSTHEHRVITPSGEVRWQQWTNRMIMDEQHRAVEFQAVGRDTTDRRMMEEMLQESAEKIKLFACSISHDLKNPAIGIQGLTKLLLKRHKDILDDKGRECCGLILKTSEQIAEFAEKINAFVAAKEAPLIIESIRLKELLQMIKREFSDKLDIRQVKWSEPENLSAIRADRTGLIRILRNLVDNALKYGGKDLTEIRIDYKESDDFHILSITDDGGGIGKDHCKKIFNPFQRHETSRGIEGTGLGLAIVKEIVEQHGGEVKVASSPEKGTTFCLSLSKHPCPRNLFRRDRTAYQGGGRLWTKQI
ncbi:MAG: PAS/PAC sensor signal transduction histidine kinase [uncultured bacterium]|nr:MAG: PAS/PAC sensor signal transduction histidine kinase [uncultured bacterium]